MASLERGDGGHGSGLDVDQSATVPEELVLALQDDQVLAVMEAMHTAVEQQQQQQQQQRVEEDAVACCPSSSEIDDSCMSLGMALAALGMPALAPRPAAALQLVHGPMRMEQIRAVWAVAGGYGLKGARNVEGAVLLGACIGLE